MRRSRSSSLQRPFWASAWPWLIGPSAAALLASSCRDYALSKRAGDAGGAPAAIGGAHDQSGGAPQRPLDHAGQSGEGNDSKQEGSSGGATGGDTAAHGGAAPAEAGASGATFASEPGPPSILGTVFIDVSGRPCAGTLQTNAWVLTSGSCVPAEVEPADIVVTSGSDRLAPQETVGVSEIARFSETDATRAPALLRLTRPLRVGSSTTGFVRGYYGLDAARLKDTSLYCLGWDMNPQLGSSTTTQSSLPRVGPAEDGTIPGTALWLFNDPESGRGAQAADEGGGCFVSSEPGWAQVAVLLDSPTVGQEGEVNDGEWTRASSLTNSAVRSWLLRTLLGRASVPGIVAERGVNLVQQAEGELALLWLDATGSMLRAPLNEPHDQQALGHPLGVEFVAQRPGAALLGETTIVVAYGSDHQLWYRQLGPQSASPDADAAGEDDLWTVVESAVTPATPAALVSEGGVVHLLALGAAGEVREAFFGGGTWQQWDDLGGGCKGTPSASSWGLGRLDYLVRGPDNFLWQRGFYGGAWQGWAQAQAATPSDPLIIDATNGETDLFMQDQSGALRLRWSRWYWLNEWVDSGIEVGQYLGGTSQRPGSYDLVESNGGEVSHLWWPR